MSIADINTDFAAGSEIQFTHFVFADGSGETAAQILKAARYQWNERADITCLPEIRTDADLRTAFDAVRACQTPVGVLATSFVLPCKDAFEEAVKNFAAEVGVPYVPIMDPVLSTFESLYQTSPKRIPGFVNAIQFARDNDDGEGKEETLRHAKIAFFGVSRAGKTSLCHHIAAQYGLRVTNCPYTPEAGILDKFTRLPDTLKIVLRRDPEQLSVMRKERLAHGNLGYKQKGYVDINSIEEEQKGLERLARQNGWLIMNVTNHAVEEAAKRAIHHLNHFRRERGQVPYTFG